MQQQPETTDPLNKLRGLTIEELNQQLDKPTSLQERVEAMEELSVRGYATVDTFDLLRREAMADTSHLSGLAFDDANYVRAAAFWTAAMINRVMNSDLNTKELPLINEVKTVIKNKKENTEIREAAVQYLQILNRPDDKVVKKLLKTAAKSKQGKISEIARDALSGKVISLPSFVETPNGETDVNISQPENLNDLLSSLQPYDATRLQQPGDDLNAYQQQMASGLPTTGGTFDINDGTIPMTQPMANMPVGGQKENIVPFYNQPVVNEPLKQVAFSANA